MLSMLFTDIPTTLLTCGVGALMLWLTFRRPPGTPPGPGFPLPLLGHLLSIGKDPKKKFREWHKQYGDIFSVYIGNRLVIVMNGYEVLKDAFVKHGDVFSDRPHVFVIDEISNGMGVLGTSGQVWKEQRRFTLSTLRDFGMGKNMLQVKINEESASFLEAIAEMKGQKFDFRDLTHTAVSNIITSVVFGKRFVYGDKFFKELTSRIDENLQSAGATAGLNFIPLARYIPGDPFKFKRTLANLAFFVTNLTKPSAAEHLKDYDESNIGDYVSAYIREIKRKESENIESSINFDNLEKVIGDLFVAGTETTATTIRWAVLLFLKYPEIQEKCFQEIKTNIGQERLPEMSDKLKLPYVEATIAEVQRVANIIPVSVWHSVPYDIQFRGYTFRKGVTIVPNIDSVLMDPEIFKDPERFQPERFLADNGKFVKPDEFIPFFLGKRVCLGESLARMELFLFITALIQRFEFQQPGDEQPPTMEAVPGVTFAPRPFKFIAAPRV
ncbi:cytochrome P450 2C23-like [Haliotis rubra]|uniref:cytochrome P450 2C23-like n=1 Tax=Haliotis rubra TaxID=36100 RepID=UPI001EE54958|nr:cytochrome P450 2C23-like [Haliotis rubra]